MELLKEWLADERLGDGRLVFLTERALAVGEAGDPDLATAAPAGLLRSAHSEHPAASA
jgi:hypothetical protein